MDLFNKIHLSVATIRFSSPVTGLAASFGSVTGEAGIQKRRSIFFERSESSGVPKLPSFFEEGQGVRFYAAAGCGGKSSEGRGAW